MVTTHYTANKTYRKACEVRRGEKLFSGTRRHWWWVGTQGDFPFLVLPFGYTFLRSFTTGLGWGRFVGLENFAQLFGNRLFLLAL